VSLRADAAGDQARRTANLPTSTAFTICGWFRRAVSQAGAYRYFLSVEDTVYPSGSNNYCLLGWNNSNSFSIAYTSGGAAFASEPAVGDWFFAALRCSGTGATDLQGRWAGVGATSFVTANSQGTTFTPASVTFLSDSWDEIFNGNGQHLRCWDAALTDEELWLEMHSQFPVRLTNLNFAWRDISASSVTDIGPNQRSATLSGTLAIADDPPVSDTLHPVDGEMMAGAGSISADGADTVTLSDTAVSVTERLSVASDTVTLSESAVSATERLSAAADTVALTESAEAGAQLPVSASDMVTLADSSEAVTGFPAEASDTLSLSEAAASVTEHLSAAEDTLSLSESAAAGAELPAVAADTVSLSESAVSTTERLSVASDTVSLADSSVSVTERPAAAADTVGLSDSAVSADSALDATASDSVSLGEEAVSILQALSSGEDSISLGEAAESVTARLSEAQDTLAFTEVATSFATLLSVGADTIVLSDAGAGLVGGDTEAQELDLSATAIGSLALQGQAVQTISLVGSRE
jgi:hypothetical protein